MRQITKVLLLIVLLAAVAFAQDRRQQKMAEEADIPTVGQPTLEKTADGWVPIFPNAATANYNHVQYFPDGLIWLGGYIASTSVNYAWKSTNYGASWSSYVVPKTNNTTFVMAARDTNIVIAGSAAGMLVRTTNGGVSWDSVYYYGAGAGFFDGIAFIGKDTVIAIGDADASGLLVVRSTDAGATWTRLTNLPAEELTADKYFGYASYRQCVSVYNQTFWAALYSGSTSNPRILKSTDAGATWNSWPVPLTGGTSNNYYFRSVSFINDSLGFAVDRQVASGSANWLHMTTNGGTTWSDTINVQPGVPHSQIQLKTIKGIPGTNIVVAGGFSTSPTAAKIYWSTNSGTNWTPYVVPGSDITNMGFASTTKGLAVGNANALQYTPKNVHAVTFMLNTATVPDTIPVVGSTIQIRGGTSNAGSVSPITWGSEAQNNMTRVGGDYWKKTVYMQTGDTLGYKYVIAYSSGTGWEQGISVTPADSNSNRQFIATDQDTTLQVEFWNNGSKSRPQYFRPWTTVADSFMNVYVRVNMLGPISSGTFGYNNDRDTVGVRGGGPAGGDLNWAPTFYLTREAAPSNGDGYTVQPSSFWSGRLRIPKSGVNVGDAIGYKFLIGYDWGRDELQGQSNRSFNVPIGKKDTTLAWVFFNNERPSARVNPDTVVATFRANLAQAISTGGFSIGDTLWVRTGYFGTAIESGRGKTMQRVTGTLYTATDTVVTSRGKVLDYQYYAVKNGTEVRENYYNFTYNGPVASEAERRPFTVPASGPIAIFDTAASITQLRRQPVFPNARPLARNVKVTFTCDLRPAYYQVLHGDTLTDIQGTFNVTPATKDSVMTWGVWINGLAVGGWGNTGTTDWGLGLQQNLNKKMYDDGTNGDKVAHDSIFSRIVYMGPDSTQGTQGRVGQVFKFGIRGGDNEGGKGGFGNNNTANVVDSDTIYTIADQFGSINPAFYSWWDFDNHRPKTGTSVAELTQPLVYKLEQNYPNPFNPSTKIEYAIPSQSQVVLKVFNVIGQEVGTLVNDVQKQGTYTVKFDASNFASGVYFYRLTAGTYTKVMKMLLVK